MLQKNRAKSEAEGRFWADLHTSGAFDAIRIIQNLIYRKLHGTDLLAFSAVDTPFFIHFELVPVASDDSLHRAHGTE